MEKIEKLPATADDAWSVSYPYLGGHRVAIYKDIKDEAKFYLAYVNTSQNYYDDSYFELTPDEYARFGAVEFDPYNDADFARGLLNVFDALRDPCDPYGPY